MCRILAAARGEAISRRFGHGLRTWSIEASGRTKRMFSPSRVARLSWTPKKHPSGEIDYTGRIGNVGDGSLRTALYDAGHIILTKPLKCCSQLKSWAMRIARRAGMSKAKVGSPADWR